MAYVSKGPAELFTYGAVLAFKVRMLWEKDSGLFAKH